MSANIRSIPRIDFYCRGGYYHDWDPFRFAAVCPGPQHSPCLWDHDSPEVLLSFENFCRCLDKVLARLPDNQRAALHLDDIGNILDISTANIRVLILRLAESPRVVSSEFPFTASGELSRFHA